MMELINKPVKQLINEITIKDILKLYISYEVTKGLISYVNQRMNETKKGTEIIT